MSCGKHHETPCTDVLAWMHVYIDNEIDESRRTAVSIHLTECSPCDDEYAYERALLARVHRCCGGPSAPDSVRLRIVTTIRQVTITGTIDDADDRQGR